MNLSQWKRVRGAWTSATAAFAGATSPFAPEFQSARMGSMASVANIQQTHGRPCVLTDDAGGVSSYAEGGSRSRTQMHAACLPVCRDERRRSGAFGDGVRTRPKGRGRWQKPWIDRSPMEG